MEDGAPRTGRSPLRPQAPSSRTEDGARVNSVLRPSGRRTELVMIPSYGKPYKTYCFWLLLLFVSPGRRTELEDGDRMEPGRNMMESGRSPLRPPGRRTELEDRVRSGPRPPDRKMVSAPSSRTEDGISRTASSSSPTPGRSFHPP
eukprot:gene1857-biopygen7375